MLPEDKEQPLVEHLTELRYRLIIILLALSLGTLFSYFLAPSAVAFLLRPLPEKRVIFLSPFDALFVRMRLALYGGAILTSPIILYQVWRFIAPALTKKERKIGILLVLIGPFLFASGAAFAYFVFPFSLRFLLKLGGEHFVPMLAADRYFAFMINFALVFGIVFELPLLSFILSYAGILTPAFLYEKKRYVLLGLALTAAIITPPDIFTMLAVLLPLFILYEISIWVARIVKRN